MSVQTITAVSFSAGTLTIPAHGRAPGDGPAALFAQPGGVIPTGLAPVTDYYVIVVDANTIKLASSSANALANVPLSFSSNGTLPLQLLIGIPYRRARTYVASSVSVLGSQVKSNDLNSFEDFDTVMWNLLTGQPQSIINGIRLANAAEASVGPINGNLDYLGNLRSLVDHNGYRMGQVTEMDERWDVGPVTASVPIFNALVSSGTWAYSTSGGWSNTASGVLLLSLDGLIPAGAIITNVVFSFSRGTTGDTNLFELIDGTGGSQIVATGKSVTSGTGLSTTDLMASPTSGFAVQEMGFVAGSTLANQFLRITTTITSSFNLWGVKVTYTLAPSNWVYSHATVGIAAPGGTDLLTLLDPQSGLNQRGAQLKGAAVSATAGASQLAATNECFMDANSAYLMEWMCKTGTITDGSAHRMFAMGLGQLITGAAPGISVYNDNTFANWQLRTILTSTVTTDSGVAIAANTVYRFRLEVFGANVSSAGAGNVRVRLYINGVKVVDVTPATTGIGAIGPKFFAGTNGTTGGPYDITVGRVRRAWNHLLAADNL